MECTPTQPSSPITRSTQHGERSINMRLVPFPFPCSHWCSGDMLMHVMTSITWSKEHDERSINMRSAPFPFPCQTCALVPGSDMSRRAWHGAPYMIYRGREVQTPDAFQSPGIRHATYIRTCTHRNSISLLYKYTRIL